MRLVAPLRKLVARDEAAIGAGAGVLGRRGIDDVPLQHGVDAVGRDDEVGLDDAAVLELQAGEVSILAQPDAAMGGVDDAGWERFGEHVQQVGAVHPIEAIPAAGVRHHDRPDDRTIHATVLRSAADAGSDRGQGGAQTHAFQLTQAVREDEDPGADFAECGRLLEHRNFHSSAGQGDGSGEAADAAADDRDA